jgi:RHS repeat-associated protein
MAKINPLRFSTKYQDDESDLVYYGFRYFIANTGRWISRDPIEEGGGRNLYSFDGNDLIEGIDRFGLAIECHCPEAYFDENGLKGKYQQDKDNKDLYIARTGETFQGSGVQPPY